MAKRRKVIRAGRLVYAAVYSTVHPSDSPEARAAKTKCSSAARQRMNMKYAWQKLELLLASNFTPRDLVVTLTYDDDHLPDDRDGAVEKIKRFWVQLRKARRLAGQSLRYSTLSMYKTSQLTYHNQLKQYVMTLDDPAAVKAVTYGQQLTGTYLEQYNTLMAEAQEQMQAVLSKLGGGSTFCCRPLTTHQQGQSGLSTAGAARSLAVDWLGWVWYILR